MSNEEQKIVELENDPVSKLLGGLKRVEAPGDFDFRVKARIASGRPVDRSASWLSATARLAVPLGLLLVIGGFLGYNALYSPGNIAVAPIAEMQVTDAAIASDVPSSEPVSIPANQDIAKSVENNPVNPDEKTAQRPNEKRTVSTTPSNRQPGGGSIDIASGIANPLTPKDPDPNRKILPKDLDRTASVSAKDILSRMGVDADSSWKVGSIKQNSRAARSGLKAGDVIEAIDGQNLTEKTTFESTGKSMRIRRGGTSVQIYLKP